MNGLDFLDKINDIDDDLLVLEKPAKVTNLRLRTTIISLAAAAGVFLIIGSVILIPRFMNKDSNAVSSVRSGGSDSGSEKSMYAEADEPSDEGDVVYEETTTSYEGAGSTVEYDDEEEEDSSFDMEDDQESDNASQQQSSEQGSKDKNTDSLYKGDVVIINNDNNITDDEGYDYLSEISESISDSGITYGDPGSDWITPETNGFCVLDITEEPMIDVGYKYYLQYSDETIISIIVITKYEDDFKYQRYIYTWLDDMYDFLEEHEGEDVVFVMDGEDLYCIAPDDSYFASNKKSTLMSDTSNLYSTYKFDENTYHVD
ncbi:MAG: hypothetical protein J6U23_00660 [Clostridiales bacterium]|nr:hypothetical protein [Clostridiales bacterium]